LRLDKLLGEVGKVLSIVEEKILARLNIALRLELDTVVAIYKQYLGHNINQLLSYLVVLRSVVNVAAEVAIYGRVDPDAFVDGASRESLDK
jgi:hypothetical protein